MKFLALEQAIRKQTDATSPMHIGGDILAEGLKVTEQGSTLAHFLEIVNDERHIGLSGNGK